MDFHQDLKLPAEAIAQIAEDARNARADQFGVRQIELCHNAEGKMYCLLEGPDEQACGDSRGLPCDDRRFQGAQRFVAGNSLRRPILLAGQPRLLVQQQATHERQSQARPHPVRPEVAVQTLWLALSGVWWLVRATGRPTKSA